MDDVTDYEKALMERMTPQHKALMHKLTPKERKSLEQNVKPEYVDLIQSWIKSDEEIEEILFWDRGGKYDDPQWQQLKPVDEISARLYEHVKARYEQLRKESVELQRRSDLTLLSQFIPSLLFSGISGAVRCDGNGNPDEAGTFFKGVELRCIGSVEDQINSITIFPLGPEGSDEFEVHFGSRIDDQPQGIWVYTGDSYSLLQLAQLVTRTLAKTDFKTTVRNQAGEMVTLDARAIRKASMEGEKLGYDDEMRLLSSVRVKGIDTAMEKVIELQKSFYERFGLEVECYKIGKKYGNFYLMREDNFDQFLPDTPVQNKGLVMLTATLVCRRCRRELKDFRDLAKSYPEIPFALVNLSSPQFKFYERVFGDMSGGDVENFRKTAAGVTPFVIIYVADDNGVLKYKEYISTGKAEAPPSMENTVAALNKYFR